MGAKVVSIFGQFNSRVLIELPVDRAAKMFAGPLGQFSPTQLVESVQRDLAKIREASEPLADSALAASALAMAIEIENPHNSATSKSMCARALFDALEELRVLTPPAAEKDALDELKARREGRLAGGAGTAG
jgi:hypothetical protein